MPPIDEDDPNADLLKIVDRIRRAHDGTLPLEPSTAFMDDAHAMAAEVMDLYAPYGDRPSFIMVSLIQVMARVMALMDPDRDELMLDILRASVKGGIPVFREMLEAEEEECGT